MTEWDDPIPPSYTRCKPDGRRLAVALNPLGVWALAASTRPDGSWKVWLSWAHVKVPYGPKPDTGPKE